MKAIAVLQSRIYDVTATSEADRLDLLDSIHVELDNLVRECGCGRDGASNNALQRRIYLNISMLVKPNVICETGFGAGHGAAAFLLGARKRALYIGFDLFNRAYGRRAADMITEVTILLMYRSILTLTLSFACGVPTDVFAGDSEGSRRQQRHQSTEIL